MTHDAPTTSTVQPHATADRRLTLWLTAIGLAAAGTWLLFDAAPGLNWLLVTVAVTVGLVALTRGALGGAIGFRSPCRFCSPVGPS